ncbi:MAG: hypothetical protein RLZZ364_1029 [Actinomycetota bacterium]
MRKSVIALAVVVGLVAGVAPSQAAKTQLTATEKTYLKYLVEEEKLARDVYAYLAANVTSQKFSNIVKSEQTHMDQVAALLKTYKVWNPTLVRKAGVFYDKELQALYNELIAQGSVSVAAAFEVGVAIEELDIADIEKMMRTPSPADIALVYSQLLKGSQNHLAAFSR